MKLFKITCVILCMLLMITQFSGCTDEQNEKDEVIDQTPKDGDTTIISTEALEGTYNPYIEYGKIYINGSWYNQTLLVYEKEEETFKTAYLKHHLSVYHWIKQNTSQNDRFLNWWDYGGMIEGIAERESLVVKPSLSLVHSIGSYNMMNEEGKKRYRTENTFSSNNTMKDVATVLTAESFSDEQVADIINEYQIDYLLTSAYELNFAPIIFSIAERSITEYFNNSEPFYNLWKGGTPTIKANNTLIYKLWNDATNLSGVKLVYEYNAGGSSNPYQNAMLVRVFKIL